MPRGLFSCALVPHPFVDAAVPLPASVVVACGGAVETTRMRLFPSSPT
jgi:hypothetical protein